MPCERKLAVFWNSSKAGFSGAGAWSIVLSIVHW
jgi:hypothetical protein